MLNISWIVLNHELFMLENTQTHMRQVMYPQKYFTSKLIFIEIIYFLSNNFQTMVLQIEGNNYDYVTGHEKTRLYVYTKFYHPFGF